METAIITRESIEIDGVPSFRYTFPCGTVSTVHFDTGAQRDGDIEVSDRIAIAQAQRMVKFEIQPKE